MNNFLNTTNFILLLIAGAQATIMSFSLTIIGAKLIARGNPAFQSLFDALCTSLLAVIVTVTGGLILEQWNFVFTFIVATNGGIFLVNLFIAIRYLHTSSN